MSSAELTTNSEPETKTTGRGIDASLQRVVDALEVVVDRFNPIMVKETRQALKSRQFVLTFFLVLIACWLTSFAVVAIIGPEVYYVAEGPRMLAVYFSILAFPLMLIVPFTAFRSLAVEQEDNTYELLSISALSTRQIISGKLSSAIVQMIVYLSAVSPCIAFTFLLRGVDAITVGLLLIYFILTSLGLSMLSLLAGTIARARYSQVVLSVLLVIGLAVAFYLSIVLSVNFISESYQYLGEQWFWIGNLIFLTVFGSTFALVHASAAAQIAFHSENRSTPIRHCMLIQQSCFLGWMAAALYQTNVRNYDDIALFIVSSAGVYWYIMGAMLTSEWPYLSRRVERSLPSSKLGTVLLTWLNPGPGTGYIFSVSNFTFMAIISAIMFFSQALITENTGRLFMQICYVVMIWSYFVSFLGVGRLFIGLIRQYLFVSLTAGLLLHLIIMLLAVGLPHLLDYLSNPQRFGVDYSLLHVTNPAWTLDQVSSNRFESGSLLVLSLVMFCVSVVIFMLNVRTIWGEVQHQRRDLPSRVAEEEALMHPEVKPASPWES